MTHIRVRPSSAVVRAGVLLACAGLASAAFAAAAEPAPTAARISGIRIDNGSTPFAGDRRLLTTVSPNGDGFRDRAIVRFRLSRRATVELEVLRAHKLRRGHPVVKRVRVLRRILPAGVRRMVWRPTSRTAPGSYILRVSPVGADRPRGREQTTHVAGVSARTPVARIQIVEAAFGARSYAPGARATVSIATDAKRLSLQILAYARGPRRDPLTGASVVGNRHLVDWRRHRDAPGRVVVPYATRRRSGLYFLRITTDDGRIGYAPFVIRPRVAVVLPTHTWQAYNFYDANGDGWGDTWYARGATRTIDLRRPYLELGVPFRFREWDLGFIDWFNRTRKQADFLSDDDLERLASGDELFSRYDLVVFAGHEEYVTRHA